MTDFADSFSAKLSTCPVVAILRGIKPTEVIQIGEALLKTGVQLVEVPLNSPTPLDSISKLKSHFKEKMLVGAGTVVTPRAVESVYEAGGQFIVSPNTDPGVIEATLDFGMLPIPGFLTPSEAFLAISSGAKFLKMFPASSTGDDLMRALREVIPNHIKVLAVGGANEKNCRQLQSAGFDGFGLGSAIYKPGRSPDDVEASTLSFIQALKTPRRIGQ